MSENAFSWQDDRDVIFNKRGRYSGFRAAGHDRHSGGHHFCLGTREQDVYAPGPVRTLKDFTPEERAVLVERYRCGFTVTS